MWNTLVTRIVARAMPPDIGDPSQEFLAATAAENAVRHTARLAALLMLVLLLVIGWLLYRGAPGAVPEASQAAALESSRVAGELSAENARLQQSLTDLQKKLDDLTSQRDALQAKLEPAPAPTPASAPDAAGKPEPPPARKPAAPAAGPPRAAGPPAPARAAAAPRDALQPSKLAPQAEKTSVRSDERYRCGDGRTVENPAECKPLGAPAQAGGTPGPGVRCGDGRTVENPSECKADGSEDLRPRRAAP